MCVQESFDIQDDSIILFEYLGFSRRSIVMAKIGVLLLVLLPSIDIIVLVGALLYRCSDHAYIGVTILLLNLFCYGMTNQADPNSISTYVLRRWIGFSAGHPTLESFAHNDNVMLAVAVSSAWVILLGVAVFFASKDE